jgi:hypothetical protein
MAKENEVVEAAAKKLKGKKAKVKKLGSEPKDTKSRPLDAKIRSALEDTLNANLKKVRVHTGGNAAELAKELGSKSFTIGNDIYFAKAGDAKNAKMVAHEVIHVMQQSTGGKMPKAKKGEALASK